MLSANVAGSGRVVLQHTRGARSGVIVTEKSVSFCGTMAILPPKGMKTAIVTEKSQLFSVTIVSWHPTTVAGHRIDQIQVRLAGYLVRLQKIDFF